ncbi:MAG: carboxypeptidase regulatory-like domain-containing protein, partial [Ruminococcus sp.]|nr:carboxypeptidase regulatory-like domain-containing protein [Ruminococcus sp.]
PIEGAAVVVSAAVDGQRIIIASGETDISGTTIRFSVPAPNERYSQIPDSGIRPYSLFDITVTARGYNDSRNTDVYVFPDITSIQNVNLIPEII